MINEKFTCRVEEIIPKLFNLDRSVIYDFQVKEHKEKRSLNANSYCWVLITKIAEKIRMSKEDCYKRMLRDYGQSDVIMMLPNIPADKYFKYFDSLGNHNGETIYRVYRGSSTYDTYEMSVLIDGVVQEAKNLDIEVMTPRELALIKETWNG